MLSGIDAAARNCEIGDGAGLRGKSETAEVSKTLCAIAGVK